LVLQWSTCDLRPAGGEREVRMNRQAAKDEEGINTTRTMRTTIGAIAQDNEGEERRGNLIFCSGGNYYKLIYQLRPNLEKSGRLHHNCRIR